MMQRPEEYIPGITRTLQVTFLGPDNEPLDLSDEVELRVKPPGDSAVQVYTSPLNPSVGVYTQGVDIPFLEASVGTWHVRWSGPGVAEEWYFFVRRSMFLGTGGIVVPSYTAELPLEIIEDGDILEFRIRLATPTTAGAMSAADKARLSDEVYIPITGEDQRVEIQAAIDAAHTVWLTNGVKQKVHLGKGVMRIGSPGLVWKSGVDIEGHGTVYKPASSWSPVVGLVDDRRNCLCKGEGTVNTTKLNTQLTTDVTPGGVPYYGAGSRVVSVASLGTVAPGDFFSVEGYESGNGRYFGQAGIDVTCCEILQVKSFTTGPNVITLVWPTKQHHVTNNGGLGVPLTVRALTPLQDVEISGITFDADGKLFAVGVLLDRVVNVRLSNCCYEGFTRSPVESFGSLGLRIDEMTLLGNNSGGLYLDSAIDQVTTELNCMATGERFHLSSTVIRAGYLLRGFCTNVRLDGFLLQRLCKGMLLESFRSATVCNGTIDDINITPEMLLDSNEHVGVGIDMGTGNLDLANFAGPLNLSNVIVTNCRQDVALTGNDANAGVFMCYSVFLHDVYELNIANLTIDNTGLSHATVMNGDSKYFITGLGLQDCKGLGMGVKIKGCEVGIGFHSSQNMDFANLEILGAPGSGQVPSIALWFNSYTNSSVRFKDSRIQGGIYFGPDFAQSTIGNKIEFINGVEFDNKFYSGPLMLARNNSNSGGGVRTPGDVVSVDKEASIGGLRWAVMPDGTRNAYVVAMGGINTVAQNGWMFLAPSHTIADVKVNGVVKQDDLLETVAGQTYLQANNATTRPVGKALSSPSDGVVRMGPA